ncbi:MAG: hypothetical protein ACRDV9_00550 [Acidimicrobiia bacterium]
MNNRRSPIRATAVGAGIVASLLSVLAGPASATPTSSCRTVLAGEVVGSIDIATQPAGGSTVFPGSEIALRVTWPTANWDGSELDRIIVCVSVDREREDHFMKMERPGPNDGVLEHSFVLPADVPIGSEVCVRSEISGTVAAQDVDHRSGITCFTVAAAPPTTTPPTTQAVVQAPITTPTTAAPYVAPQQVEASPAPIDAAPLALVELPRTGSALVLAQVGLGLALGGSMVLASAKRRRRP